MRSVRPVLRPARPDLDEGVRFADYMNQASHGLARLLFGPSYKRIIANAYLDRGHDMSHTTAVFAEFDGEIVGMASAYSAEEHEDSSDWPVIRAARLRMVRMLPMAILGRGLLSFIDTVPDDDYYLAALAVDADRRGSGIGSMLLEDCERRARSAGCRRLALDVAADNPDARRLYERRGMQSEATSPPIMFMPDQRVHRMVKEI